MEITTDGVKLIWINDCTVKIAQNGLYTTVCAVVNNEAEFMKFAKEYRQFCY